MRFGKILAAATGAMLIAGMAPAADTLFEQARAATEQKKFKEALKTYAAIINMRGEDASVRHNRALIYLEIGEPRQARREVERAVELIPEEGLYRITLAVTYLVGEKPHLRRAETILRKAVRLLDKKNDYAGLANAYYNLGVIEQKRLDLVEARAYYERALEYNPAHEDVRLALEVLPPSR